MIERSIRFVSALAALSVFAFGATPAFAEGAIVASEARIALVEKEEISQPAYLVLQNTSDKPMVLIRVRSGSFPLAMIHQSITDEGETRMMLKQELLIPANSTVELKPGGLHLMFSGIRKPLKKGDTVKAVLTFQAKEPGVPNETLTVEFEAKNIRGRDGYRKPSKK